MLGVSNEGVQKAFPKTEAFPLPKGGQERGLFEETYCVKKKDHPLLESDGQ